MFPESYRDLLESNALVHHPDGLGFLQGRCFGKGRLSALALACQRLCRAAQH
jgi:hypothetical protein